VNEVGLNSSSDSDDSDTSDNNTRSRLIVLSSEFCEFYNLGLSIKVCTSNDDYSLLMLHSVLVKSNNSNRIRLSIYLSITIVYYLYCKC